MSKPSNQPAPRTWLWPDHAIGKGESRQLREEHNHAVNTIEKLRAALASAEGWLSDSDVAYLISNDKGEQSAYCRMMVEIHAAIRAAQVTA